MSESQAGGYTQGQQTNVDKLVEAGVLDPHRHTLSDQHRNIINNEFTDDEVDALISMKNKLGVGNFTHEDGGAF
jgi:hypothetical protein